MPPKWSLPALLFFLTACINPQPLPIELTPIPTLPPATLPVIVSPTPAGETAIAPTTTPETTPSTDNRTPATETTGDATAGEAVFTRNCSSCHNVTSQRKVGPGLAGMFQEPTLPNGAPINDANLGEWIHTGGDGMPPVPLSPTDTANVIAYLKKATQP